LIGHLVFFGDGRFAIFVPIHIYKSDLFVIGTVGSS
jgi:hypothetical protein